MAQCVERTGNDRHYFSPIIIPEVRLDFKNFKNTFTVLLSQRHASHITKSLLYVEIKTYETGKHWLQQQKPMGGIILLPLNSLYYGADFTPKKCEQIYMK